MEKKILQNLALGFEGFLLVFVGFTNPKLDTRISFFFFFFFVLLRRARTTPSPEIWNGLDWRALVESRPPNIGKLRG